MSKPSIPSGTRDFSPEVVRKRQYILSVLKSIFEQYGFQPLETPAMENLGTLTGKYGEEGDRLIFKILNNGLHEKKEQDKARLNTEWSKMLERPFSSVVVTERALRYDLTIPFARYVVMHQNELAFPFRRYQMQPVWRADRPQKGRYREFWQCDADVVGSNSLVNEAELLRIYTAAFDKLFGEDVRAVIKINNRKILLGIAEVCGISDKLTDFTTALDKLDKIGWEGVENELLARGINETAISKIRELLTPKYLNISQANDEKLNYLFEKFNGNSEIGVQGVKELKDTLAYYNKLGEEVNSVSLTVEVSLARGLNYYTGFIVEVLAYGESIGSIAGGGRYDDLTSLFGLRGMSGVGISFGIDRIYDVMENNNLFPPDLSHGTQVLAVNYGGEDEAYALSLIAILRKNGIRAEIFPDGAKFEKQIKYAEKNKIPFMLIARNEERLKHGFSLKNLNAREQKTFSIADGINYIKDHS